MESLTNEQLGEYADKGIGLWRQMGSVFANKQNDEEYLKIAIMALGQDVYRKGYKDHEEACQKMCMFCGTKNATLFPFCRYVSCASCYNYYIKK